MVTLDRTLPGSLNVQGDQPFIITLDALIQWVSPIIAQGENEANFASAFSEAIKYQLLPKDTFFELRDFLIFAEMQMSCKELPAADVEGCIQYIKIHAPNFDLANPKDREKIAYEVSKYFADPGRKYKKEVERLELEVKGIKDKTELEKKNIIEDYESKLGSALERVKEIENKFASKDKSYEDSLDELKKELGVIKDNNKENLLRQSAFKRLWLIFIIFLTYEYVIINYEIQHSRKETLIKKIIDIKEPWLIGVGIALIIILSWFILGKKRISVLCWPIKKLLRCDKE